MVSFLHSFFISFYILFTHSLNASFFFHPFGFGFGLDPGVWNETSRVFGFCFSCLHFGLGFDLDLGFGLGVWNETMNVFGFSFLLVDLVLALGIVLVLGSLYIITTKKVF
jgi:hypothetical protein